MTRKILLPSDEIRNFKCSDFIGKVVEIECKHKIENSQFVSTDIDGIGVLSGWTHEFLISNKGLINDDSPEVIIGREGEKIKAEIKSIGLVESMNGGRKDKRVYYSYWEYFNEEKKEEIFDWKTSSFEDQINQEYGDIDRLDIIIQFENFAFQDLMDDFHYPYEWYSEIHGDKVKISKKNFFKTDEEATEYFSNLERKTLFGERYFPVIVFPVNTDDELILDVIWRPKVCSDPIIKGKYIIYGTRCKSYEYEEVIKETYKIGGFVVKNKEWDWD